MENKKSSLFDKLVEIQDLIKKEASLKEMCNLIYIIYYSHKI
jgi:hypothetical protein